MEKLTAARLREVLNYEPETGVFCWRTRRGSRAAAGQEAGTIGAAGYVQIQIDGSIYYAHRLAWLYMTGEWPSEEVDHQHISPGDNRWEALRAASRAQNECNKRCRRDNRTGLKGAFFRADTGRWRSRIKKDGRATHLGTFKTAEEAHEAYVRAAREAHGDFARAG